MTDFINQTDQAIARYYKLHGVNDYFDHNGVGRFKIYCHENKLNEVDVREDLNGDHIHSELVDFDDQFPGVDQCDYEAIFNILKQCCVDPKKSLKSLPKVRILTAADFHYVNTKKKKKNGKYA
eukprot:33982_1